VLSSHGFTVSARTRVERVLGSYASTRQIEELEAAGASRGGEALLHALGVVDPDGEIIERLRAAAEAFTAQHGNTTGELYTRLRAMRHARSIYLRSRNRFICTNLRLVVSVAKRYGRHHMPLADRVQEGNLGLLKAVERFDPERGVRFSTYAAWWIRHAVMRALVKHGRTVRIPAHVHALFTKVRQARACLRAKLGRPPALEEIAAWLEVTPDKVRGAIEAMEFRAVGFHESASANEDTTVADRLRDERQDGWSDRVGDRIDARLADGAVDSLDKMAFDIVVHRFGLRRAERETLRGLGERYELSRERIRQLQNRALKRLREAVEHSPVTSLSLA
jgi:RNA polymerase primary sigma factor